MKGKCRVLLVDDHALLRQSVRILLSNDPDIEVVGEADNGRDAVRAVGTLSPHLVLTDLAMPRTDGLDAVAEIRRRYPHVRIIVLSMHKLGHYVHQSLKAGANGYVLKEATHEELAVAIRSVLAGKTYLSPDISDKVLNGYLGRNAQPASASPWDTVTQRERQVLKLIAEGYANTYIAKYLCISVKTVRRHRCNLMRKLDLHNASLLTAYAIKNGLVLTDLVPAPVEA